MRLVPHLFLCFAFLLSACQTLPPSSQLPSPEIHRTAETPLVVGIPGLRLPPAPSQEECFGQLEPILEREGFPTTIIIYDSETHHLRSGADLSSEYSSVAVTRILPALVQAIRGENKIRKSQGLSSLSEVDLVGYSQGSVLTLDVLNRLRDLRARLTTFFQVKAKEYEELVKDPEFRAFNNTAEDYIAIRNIKVQREKDFENDPDLKLIYEHSEMRVVADFKRFYNYLTGPKTHYPKLAKVIRKDYEGKDISKIENLNDWLDYAQFRVLLPIQFQFFSIAGSLFGSPEANSGYYFIKNYPALTGLFVDAASSDQIRDTQVGSEHQMQVLVGLLDEIKKTGVTKRTYENTYFMVGANGEKGDGLVEQFSAHLSEHMLSTLDLEALRHGSAGSLKTETTPKFRATGIRAYHRPKRGLFSSRLGIAEIEPKSLVRPFLLAFLRKDDAALSILHAQYGVPLRQFMVEIQTPASNELTHDSAPGPGPGQVLGEGAKLIQKAVDSSKMFTDKGQKEILKIKVMGHSKNIKISRSFDNSANHTLIVTGVFTSKKAIESRIQFSIEKDKEQPLDFEVTVRPGKIHFVTLLDGSFDQHQ